MFIEKKRKEVICNFMTHVKCSLHDVENYLYDYFTKYIALQYTSPENFKVIKIKPLPNKKLNVQRTITFRKKYGL